LAAVPAEYGPRTTLFNRFDRWSEKGIWQGLLAALVACEDSPDFAMVDSTAVRAHRSAAGAKEGNIIRPSAARVAHPRPKSTGSLTQTAVSTL
jgi:transposase